MLNILHLGEAGKFSLLYHIIIIIYNNCIRYPIYSLGFGEGADIDFLKKLSLNNSGFARVIYEASDASLQLRNFYKEISSPVLSNVTFKYIDTQVKCLFIILCICYCQIKSIIHKMLIFTIGLQCYKKILQFVVQWYRISSSRKIKG